MTANASWRDYVSIETDYWAVVLAFLFLVVLGGALAVGTWLSGMGVEPAMSGSSTSEQAAAGGGWAIAEVVAAVVLLGVVTLWQRLPEWLQDVVKTGTLVVASMVAGAYLAPEGATAFWAVAAMGVGYYGLSKAADAYDVYWILNNIEGVAFAIVAGGAIGAVLPLPFLVVGIVGLTIYDHVFANQNEWMFTIGAGLLKAKLPLVIFAMPSLRVDWDDLCDAMTAEEDRSEEFFPNDSGFGIGTADLLLPAALAVAVVTAVGTPMGGVVPVVGISIGVMVAAFRLRWEMLNIGSGAGLPAITSGALGGWAVGIVVVMSV